MKIVRVLVLCMVLLGTAAFAAAQSNLRVEVPFAFQVGNRVLPAGTYSVTRIFDGDPSLLALTGVHTKARVNVYGSPTHDRPGASLSFLRYGETYFLTAISSPSGKLSVATSGKQRQMASVQNTIEVTAGSQ